MSAGRSRAGAAALVALLLGAPAASAGIAELGGTNPGDLMFPAFADADTCANCHGGGVGGDTTFLPSDTWAGTMMANAARDPVFFAALTVANQDAPGVGTYCLRCHSPIAYVEGHATPPDGSAFDARDRGGVGCDTCHRAQQSPAPEGPYLLGDAQLVYGEAQIYGGPFTDSMSPAHLTQGDEGLDDPRFCGQCHQVTNPEVHLRDAAGMDTGLEFPLDTTYLEWASSDYAVTGDSAAATCTDCHMPKKQGGGPVTRIPGSPHRDDLRMHAAVGGNHWGIDAVKAANPDRAAKYPKAFELAQERTLDSLSRAVKVTLGGAPASLTPGASFQITVRVENLTGHKFPTGYAESRRAWIGVSLVDAAKQERALLGGYDASTGAIQAAPPTRVYRAQHGRWNGSAAQPDEHLALHDAVVSDTRIPPRGFHAAATTTPTGEIDFADGQGGYHSFDEVTLTLTAPVDAAGDTTLSARVYYQSMTRDHIEFLKSANVTDTRGSELEAIYQSTGQAPPLVIAVAEAKVIFPGGASSASSASGGGGSGGSGGAGTTSASSGGGAPAPASQGCGCRVDAGASAGAAGALTALLVAAASARRRRACWTPARRRAR